VLETKEEETTGRSEKKLGLSWGEVGAEEQSWKRIINRKHWGRIKGYSNGSY
jgi:hypothetical protein